MSSGKELELDCEYVYFVELKASYNITIYERV